MAKYQTSDIRNVALVGHGSVGKTTLGEAMLFKSGAVKRMGSVDDGTSLFDFESEERERKFSIDPAMVFFNLDGVEFNLIDSPGYPDFLNGAVSALAAADTAIICVSALDGIQVNTLKVWQMAGEMGKARIIVVTKLDNENIDLPALFESIKETFGGQAAPAFVCDATGAGITKSVPVFGVEVPPELADAAAELRTALTESIVEQDDDMMNRYLEGEEISAEELTGALKKAIASGAVVPILGVASRKMIGVDSLMKFLADMTPSPDRMPPAKAKKGDAEIEILPDPNGAFCARVFRCVTDPFVGKLSYFRVLRGSLGGDMSFHNTRARETERCGHIYRMFGKEQREVHEALPGDILTAPKLETIKVGDTLCSVKEIVELPPMRFPKPMMPLAAQPVSKGDEQRLSNALQRLSDEDPTFDVRRDRQTGELIVTGMSTLHLEVMIARMKKRFEVSVVTSQPEVPYQETCTLKAEGKHRHKKQTGGRGQYAEVFLRVEPRERGAGFEFLDEIVGGVIPRQYIPACEKGIRECLEKGIIAGFPVVDIAAAVHYGSYHDVDSSEAAFKLAASRALQNAFTEAKPVLLEPIVRIEVTIPSQYLGDIAGHLTSRRGRIIGMDASGSYQVVQAHIPMAEVMQYSTELKSMTGGQGSFTLDFSHYDPVPSHVQQQIIEKRKKAKEEDE
ncbi:MAG TPA: elongation factor G [Candidatus Brocadiia bacterium]|nr:elongation factor G [Candidatus Brocadiia bacterium]